MKIFTTRQQLQHHLATLQGKTIGFVPTMGALHNGHLSLINQAKQNNDVVVCSIFVNPTQFNDPNDLKNYPRPIEADIAKLEAVNCDVLFTPGVDEIYDDNEQWHLDIGQLEFLLEGEFRPGHYQGVTQVVYKLLNIVKPATLYLGQKDYQQFKVISRMVKMLEMPIKLVMSPIAREPEGLAMSSRNIHLSPDERRNALALSQTLNWVKENFKGNNIAELEEQAMQRLQDADGVEPEYFELADGETLLPADEHSQTIVALTAARVGKTRLIDNVLIR